MSCGDNDQLGCNGGSAFRAWERTSREGIVTGGDFGSREVNSKPISIQVNEQIFITYCLYRVANHTEEDRATISVKVV